MITSDKAHLYMFGGSDGTTDVRELQLDVQNSVATVRNVSRVGSPPSPRGGHGAVMIGSSLMVVWGGQGHNGQRWEGYSDFDIHIFNLSESLEFLRCRLGINYTVCHIKSFGTMEHHHSNRTWTMRERIPWYSCDRPNPLRLRRVF